MWTSELSADAVGDLWVHHKWCFIAAQNSTQEAKLKDFRMLLPAKVRLTMDADPTILNLLSAAEATQSTAYCTVAQPYSIHHNS